ncbi:MAG: Coenzyme F420 hydrogenase/dehydrogenase, beta subunit C-terminal domain [Candidatus Lokiarchaeota archaeon]
MTAKSFQDLITEVHEKGICQECGGCVSFCSSAEYDVIKFEEPNKPPIYVNKENCLECGICYCICPQTHYLHEELDNTYKITDPHSMSIGFYKDVHSCQATDLDFLENGTDGGVVNSLIDFMIKENMIDGAIVAKMETPFSRESTIAYNKEDLLSASGATLDISTQLSEVQKFSTYTHSIPKLNHYKFKKLAVVGTPCQIYTIRCMKALGVTPSENVEICLGLFCYENFFFEENQIEKFEKDFNIKLRNIEKVNIKEDLIFNLKSENGKQRTVHIPFNHLNQYMRSACNACSDFTNVYADISFGGLGSQDKFTTVIPRTEKGQKIFSQAKDANIFKCMEMDTNRKKRVKDLIIKLAKAKIERYLNYMKKLDIQDKYKIERE